MLLVIVYINVRSAVFHILSIDGYRYWRQMATVFGMHSQFDFANFLLIFDFVGEFFNFF